MEAELSLGQQKNTYNRRRLYLLSLGEEIVKQDIRKRVHSGNCDRHTPRVMRVMVSLENKQLPLQLRRKNEEGDMAGVLFVQLLRTEERTGNVSSAQNECARTTV